MTRKEAKAILENDIVGGHVEGNARFMDAFWMAVDALSQKPCDDAISRDFLFRVLDNFCGHDRTATITLDTLADIVYELPSVTQKSKTGHWIEKHKIIDYVSESTVRECSECGAMTLYQDKYCHECGAKMVEPQEKRCADCNHYGKLSLDCGRCDDDCSMYEPQESEDKE